MNHELVTISNEELAKHLLTLEAAEGSMSSRQAGVRNLLESIEDPDWVGADVCDSLRAEDQEITERRLLLQEQIAELVFERNRRLEALRHPKRKVAA